jgi:hypothetical protein
MGNFAQRDFVIEFSGARSLPFYDASNLLKRPTCKVKPKRHHEHILQQVNIYRIDVKAGRRYRERAKHHQQIHHD